MPLLQHEEVPVRAEVAKALAQFQYQDAAEPIAAAIPTEFEEGEGYYVYAMISAVKELDSGRGAALARKHLEKPAMKHAHSLLRGLLRD